MVTQYGVSTEYLVLLHPHVFLPSFPTIPQSFILSATNRDLPPVTFSTQSSPLTESGYTVLPICFLFFFPLPVCSQSQMKGLGKKLYSLIYGFLFLMMPTERQVLLFCIKSPSYLLVPVPMALRADGLRIILSRALTICSNLGLWTLSFCQQSSISKCKTVGQSGGGGRR